MAGRDTGSSALRGPSSACNASVVRRCRARSDFTHLAGSGPGRRRANKRGVRRWGAVERPVFYPQSAMVCDMARTEFVGGPYNGRHFESDDSSAYAFDGGAYVCDSDTGTFVWQPADESTGVTHIRPLNDETTTG